MDLRLYKIPGHHSCRVRRSAASHYGVRRQSEAATALSSGDDASNFIRPFTDSEALRLAQLMWYALIRRRDSKRDARRTMCPIPI